MRCSNQPSDVSVVGRKCETCGKTAVYNFADEKGKKGEGARFCKKHALPDMVNIVSKRCKKCSKIPCFNKPGEKTGLYCRDHAEEGMVDVTNRQCAKDGCTTSPTFNVPGEKIGKFCVEHASPEMENVTAKRCLKCSKQARFNKPECTNGLYCAEHSETGMIDVLCKRCAAEGCPKQPTYNWAGSRPQYCIRHATKGRTLVPMLPSEAWYESAINDDWTIHDKLEEQDAAMFSTSFAHFKWTKLKSIGFYILIVLLFVAAVVVVIVLRRRHRISFDMPTFFKHMKAMFSGIKT